MNSIAIDKRELGVNYRSDATTDICIWAPKAESLVLTTGHLKLPLTKYERGYWHGKTGAIKPGDEYKFELNHDKLLADPCSLSQPNGVFGKSEVIDLRFEWTDTMWRNPPLNDYIIYELHTGTFEETGDFEGIISHIPYLKDLGITAIEIMPVAQFSGARNWGYDGVFPYAVQNTYGGVKGLQKLVNACHDAGIAVVLDVVYNHIGPEGSVLHEYGYYFTDKYKTPWGDAVNFDDAGCDEVRRFFIENVLMWFRDFHIDALRLDAVHAIKDFSPKHILKEMKEYVDELMKFTGRTCHMIVECDLNDIRFIDANNGYGMDAQWADEFHHALRVSAGQPREGYYHDFNGIQHLAKAYEDAYVYDGIYSPHRMRTFGTNTEGYPGKQFIVFSQNHDQVGNRMLGERTSSLVSFEMQKLLAGAVMISPYVPLLFMGEESALPNPFLYFVDHSSEELCTAVREGRAREFAAFHNQGTPPDPTAVETFKRSKLNWDLPESSHHQVMLRYYKALIALRKQNTVLKQLDRTGLETAVFEEQETLIVYRQNDAEQLACILNFSKQHQSVSMKNNDQWRKIWDSGDAQWNGPGASSDNIQNVVTILPESILIYATNNV